MRAAWGGVFALVVLVGCGEASELPCESDRACTASGLVCARDLGVCVECVSGEDCLGADEVCRANDCTAVTPCDSSRDCPGLVCDLDRGYCVECVTDVDCPGDETCASEGLCQPPPTLCESDRQCADLEQVCDFESGECVDCLRDADCPADRVCRDRRCGVGGMDGGPSDSGQRDAGARDAGGADARADSGSCIAAAASRCSEGTHSLCETLVCDSLTYVCSDVGGWAWRTSTTCDDGDACTFGDVCSGASCAGTAVVCASTDCLTRACNGSASCTETANTGVDCEDGDLCTFGDSCSAGGACEPGATLTCSDTTCLDRSCDGTETCAEVPQNIGGLCNDGDPATPVDRCQSDGTCVGGSCSSTLASVFADDFSSPSSSTWTAGSDASVGASRWDAYTSAMHGVRVFGGQLEITNQRLPVPEHGQGYAYVRAGGVGADYDSSIFSSTLASNVGQEVVWSFNMRRNDPETENGGFSCVSPASQNGRTIGLAYVLGASSASGLQADPSVCSPTGTADGYAVVFGSTPPRVRLVEFTNGLRNGTLTTIAESAAFVTTTFLSVRVTYDAASGAWQLEARDDGLAFADPSAGGYSSTATGLSSLYTSAALDFAGPYFQTGCCCLCISTHAASFDNVRVGIRCGGP